MVQPGSLLERFVESARAVGAGVTVVPESQLVEALTGLLPSGEQVLVSPELALLSEALLAQGVQARIATTEATSGELSAAFRQAGAGVTGALAAIASSGSVAVGPGVRNGGLLAALPPHHVVVLHERDIKPNLAGVLAVLDERFAELAGEAVIVTGPSRTADIEMMTVLGVHGPLALDIVVTRSAA